MFASAHLSSAVAGINRDGCRSGRTHAARLVSDVVKKHQLVIEVEALVLSSKKFRRVNVKMATAASTKKM